jgi:hypothetical protein
VDASLENRRRHDRGRVPQQRRNGEASASIPLATKVPALLAVQIHATIYTTEPSVVQPELNNVNQNQVKESVPGSSYKQNGSCAELRAHGNSYTLAKYDKTGLFFDTKLEAKSQQSSMKMRIGCISNPTL